MVTQIVIEHDPASQQFDDAVWQRTIAHMEATHPAYETLRAIQRATGYEATAFDMLHPAFDWTAVHAHIRAGWAVSK